MGDAPRSSVVNICRRVPFVYHLRLFIENISASPVNKARRFYTFQVGVVALPTTKMGTQECGKKNRVIPVACF